jgi:hypothetical protein
MKVSRASLNDMAAILEYSRRAFSQSVTYQATGYNEVIWRNTLKAAFADPTMVVFVSRVDARITGLLVGMRMPMPWSAGFCASDLVFVAERGGRALLRAFVAWCRQHKVRRIDMGVSDTQGVDATMDRLFTGVGFSKAGGVYYRIEV